MNDFNDDDRPQDLKDAGLSWSCAWRVFIKKWVDKRQQQLVSWYKEQLQHIDEAYAVIIAADPSQECSLRSSRSFFTQKVSAGKLRFPDEWLELPGRCPDIPG